MSYFEDGVLIEDLLQIDLSSTPNVTLVENSEKRIIITGTAVSPVITLPNTSGDVGVPLGREFHFQNDSDVQITINYDDASQAGVVEPGITKVFTFIDVSTGNGTVNSNQKTRN